MPRVFAAILLVLFSLIRPAAAQQAVPEVAWVQIEAHPSLSVARDRAEAFAARLEDVNGFALGGGWYGIALGPYAPADAEQVLRVYRLRGDIPRDSYIVGSDSYSQQFWPPDADVLRQGTLAAPAPTPETNTAVAEPAAPARTQAPADETPAQARRSEQLLTAQDRRDLQTALAAAGFYNAAIDGAFGRGTRASMADWQAARGYEATGVLTTLQRRALMDEYNAPLISVGMRYHRDDSAGIAMQMPLGAVKFSRYESPFAHYDATTPDGIRLLLISQPGDQATLFGLYDILQTLEIVPTTGPRAKDRDSFTIEGRGQGIVSYTQASLQGGEIKGFTLVWPEGDEARRDRVLTAMRQSFERLDGVLDPAAGADAPQDVDLVSGLAVRKPRLSRSGFYVDARGTVLTAAANVAGCGRITLDHDYEAQVMTTDSATGLALLRPTQMLAPMTVAQLRPGAPRLGDEVAVSGYSYGGVLGAATLTFGTVADLKGLNGEAGLTRLALSPLAGDAGGPLLDQTGAVLGVLLPATDGAQRLPDGVSFAANAGTVASVLTEAGVEMRQNAIAGAPLPPDDLSRLALGMTVLVGCWD
ncbi:serine protease [Pseudodonghicola flavimaris]|uniref:Serine protease n=1 Tax=Pseudodonghicola flavimaris TaxID=3050036 RepID=A0ABT7F038_9RHOB|nr:serine protease [Pseudodonghicola flavimaris]MDK3017957.1 serine protease [Pseudodonghicola flavimaris]